MPDFSLSAYLNENASWVEASLDQLLPPEQERPALIHQAIRYSLLNGGKRIRPILCVALAEACGASREAAQLPAIALECLHTYTLIHDDLPSMDNDDLRRGRPTCHKAFPEGIAVLAGDALQALAFQLLSRTGSSTLWKEFSDAAVGVIYGQVEDIQSEAAPPPAAQAADVLDYIHTHKTGDLIVCACRMGIIAANGSPAQLQAATAYGRAIGRAFQIADDLLNVTSTPEALGKAVGSDAARGKLTYVTFHGVENAKAKMLELADTAIAQLDVFPDKQEPLAAIARHIIQRLN